MKKYIIMESDLNLEDFYVLELIDGRKAVEIDDNMLFKIKPTSDVGALVIDMNSKIYTEDDFISMNLL